MTVDGTDDEFHNISERNYSKISEKLEKIGYKEGKHDGVESQFQQGFDIGYENGFRNGFILGKYKGLLTTKDNCDLILQRPSRGQCVLCVDKTLLDQSISSIVETQSKHSKKVAETLSTRYGSNN